ncbi:GGDEF domain-containing protein [Anaerobacillus alkaliphilus]|uniref:GGDEF domain-containing protein n=1 Tax=Anaerobacillus alkaliphilus TaxID=1548597 RepID=A0A4Q0VVG9_9BACI|nr:GGDEF domain-containing protein [Anaerobacillus alkaliphilus]RXJ02860.1 GGDEF domain-containing protein [Anaerobacillus alkaliphilus]
MRRVIVQAYQSDHALEMVFSSLRWFFLILSVIVFLINYIDNPVELHLILFSALVVFGCIYMGLSDFCLYKAPESSKAYLIMTKGGPFFDFVSFFALIALTGGIYSPLTPIAYLIILHVSVYWRLVGAMTFSLLFMLGFTILFMVQGYFIMSFDYITYLTQLVFLLLVGLLGGIVVSRERYHFSEKNTFENLANKDHLTNLDNHRSFQEQLRVTKDKDTPFYLVFADIDGFKKINDQYGHVVGDIVLKKVAKVLRINIPEDIGSVFRYGGEEFAILIYTDEQRYVEELLANLKEKISEEVHYCNEGKFTVTMSFGCKRNSNEEEPIKLIDEADKLLYQAKRQGKNRVVYELLDLIKS